MNFDHSEQTLELLARLQRFMDTYIAPREQEQHDWVTDPARVWQPWPGLEELKEKARAEGLWNLFLPKEYGDLSPGLSNLEYAPLCEIMGRIPWSAEVFNCSAPDTGNMEVLAKYGNAEQQERWLKPLMDGEIRSAYLMTEPQVASSDATNIETEIKSDGDDYVINGRKWWISGIMDPRCKVLLLMGKTDPDAPRHQQQSTVIIPRDTPGIHIVRNLTVFGSLNSPGGEAELRLENVRIPKRNLILGEGRGFEIAQGRLGPGRIHHCMRSIGQAQRSLEIMARRVENRVAFGRKLSEQSSIRQDIARSFCDIEQARLLTLKAADRMDKYGNKDAKDLIAAIKVVAPQMAQNVTDRAIQAHGGMGVSDDTPIAHFFTLNRFVRIADGPDEVHMSQLGKMKIQEYNDS
ncbi:acyl-CoA dehydrogenase family protein [Alloalcanivorax xenomutans]|jgi:acyl-CoA dehydrogenase|uniref:Acyl-CoA dehydrogenase family protein n=1 Tax=Alloalcanivorax xenomutans TaxID=1094342 RepID=A0A9Q3WA00_9GAMM|nr:acyl-CoA dehydrogenase family protein [Alloalcanivorax xenomutans]ERS10925.1 acyl-CoA dehydrogenase [Alcanivorax sp. PN-3]MBA4720160.1 acyl-CoA dehydrogenase family protein [Alcanivorax sp.]ARB45642.1 acyl-CoA dehydrogenase [Alloalcanivorax xenomutans]MCE7510867.1 acyl-CoA dehydrogenase family protein [Alloalcanivorax xenomutans]MCE7524834.1 acyl-CoA dehydrogenase family protein [Alloalcanivorax xenomutans]